MTDTAANPFESDLADAPASLSLRGVSNADQLITAAGGAELLRMLRTLGFWVGGGQVGEPSRGFTQRVSDLSSGALGDENSYWQSELSRVIAISGALNAQMKMAKLSLQRSRATAAAAILQQVSDDGEKPPTKTLLDLKVSQRPEVQQNENNLVILEAAIAALDGARESIEGYTRMLSREITRRGDLARARM